jgi:hypothetical protein
MDMLFSILHNDYCNKLKEVYILSITTDHSPESTVRKRTYRHWTTLEDRKLKELRQSGMKFKHIAIQLSRTAISVEKRYRKITSTSND